MLLVRIWFFSSRSTICCKLHDSQLRTRNTALCSHPLDAELHLHAVRLVPDGPLPGVVVHEEVVQQPPLVQPRLRLVQPGDQQSHRDPPHHHHHLVHFNSVA